MPNTNNRPESGSVALANLKRLAYFAAVVEGGSFTAAAERLGITKAVVSQQVARLERDFQTQLLTRTTRRVVATEAGMAFHERCCRILREAGDAFDELADVATEPSGTLRLTAPLDYGLTRVVGTVVEFSRKFPQCKVDLALSDQFVDLNAGEAELAIRVGWLTDLELQARRIGTFQQWLVAAPHWAGRLRRNHGPEQITGLPFVANAALKTPETWTFSRTGGVKTEVTVNAAIRLDTTLAVREAVCQGGGLSILPDYAVATELAQGRLVRLLPAWMLPSGGIHVVYPTARFRPAKVKRFVDMLLERQQT
jgi:DNA-binding transcriptional LysR family regulator